MYPIIFGTSMISDLIGGGISDGLQWILNNTIFRLLYWVAAAFCWIIGILYSMFEVMAGLVKVTYDGEKQYLINIFFGNSAVSKVYWGMAMIGFVLCFAFTIIAVVRKMFDMEGKMQSSMGQILGSCLKSIILIGLMSAFMLAMLNMTNILIQQIMYIFNNSEDLGKEKTITYTDEEYAAMARVLNTIGNYSLNPAWTSRYNINSCFNDFREDLQWLYDQGVFEVYYDDSVIKHTSWQSELEKIVYTVDLSEELPLNIYNENLQAALEHVVEVMETDKKFKPISSYVRTTTTGSESVPLDRILFLACTMRAANNASFNENPSFTDALRAPYYTGAKSIYDYDTVIADFDIGLATDYILLFLIGVIMVKDLMEIIFTCVSRIFNMILLYLISPPLIAASPLDGGGKLKQWISAMVVQSFGVFGTIISMRIMMLLIPIILGSDLILFDNIFLNIFGKIILIVGAIEVEKKAQGLITGILADNAGMQAITAGDMKETAGSFITGMGSLGWGATKMAGKTGLFGAKMGAKGAYYGGKGVYYGGKYAGKGVYYGGKYAGKGIMAAGSAIGAGASWIGNKVGGMFSKDTGSKNPEKTPPIEFDKLRQNQNSGGGSSGGGSGTTEPQKRSWLGSMFSGDKGAAQQPGQQSFEMQDLSSGSKNPEKAPEMQSEQAQQGAANNNVGGAGNIGGGAGNVGGGGNNVGGAGNIGGGAGNNGGAGNQQQKKYAPGSSTMVKPVQAPSGQQANPEVMGNVSNNLDPLTGKPLTSSKRLNQPKPVQQNAGGAGNVGGGSNNVGGGAGSIGGGSNIVVGGAGNIGGGAGNIGGGSNNPQKEIKHTAGSSTMVKPVQAPAGQQANPEVMGNVSNNLDPLSGNTLSKSVRPAKKPPVKNNKK